jgi:FAD synthetase
MKKIRVMVFGVFDLLHPGHVDFLKQARELGDFLIVSVARDVNVIRVKEKKPIHNEKQRLLNVGKVPYADKIVLGGLKDPWPHIVKEKPDIIALGYDQKTYIANQERQLKEQLEKHELKKTEIVRLKAHWPEVYKSRLIRKNFA